MFGVGGKSWADLAEEGDDHDHRHAMGGGRAADVWADEVREPEPNQRLSREVEVRSRLRTYNIEHDSRAMWEYGKIQLARSVRRREYMRGNEDDFYHGNSKLFELPASVRQQLQKMHQVLQEAKPPPEGSVAPPTTTPAPGATGVPGTLGAVGTPAASAGTLSSAGAAPTALGAPAAGGGTRAQGDPTALGQGANTVYVPKHLRPGAASNRPMTGQTIGGGTGSNAMDIAHVQHTMGFGQARLPAYATGQSVGHRTLADDYTVRVTNIGDTCSETALKELFKDAGDIAKVYHPKNNDPTDAMGTRKYKGFAFITFSTRDGAQRAIEKFNNYGMDHLVMHVEWAQARPPR